MYILNYHTCGFRLLRGQDDFITVSSLPFSMFIVDMCSIDFRFMVMCIFMFMGVCFILCMFMCMFVFVMGCPAATS